MTASHVKIGLFALALALLLGAPAAWMARGDRRVGETDIAIEHTAPVTLRISRLRGSGANVFDVGFSGSGTIALHLPASWIRQEVRGAPIASVTHEPQAWDFVRWTLPAGATVRFDTPDPGRVTLHNPSGIPVTVRTTTVSAATNAKDDDATIVTDDPYTLP